MKSVIFHLFVGLIQFDGVARCNLLFSFYIGWNLVRFHGLPKSNLLLLFPVQMLDSRPVSRFCNKLSSIVLSSAQTEYRGAVLVSR